MPTSSESFIPVTAEGIRSRVVTHKNRAHMEDHIYLSYKPERNFSEGKKMNQKDNLESLTCSVADL
jgi:hypothetical protein